MAGASNGFWKSCARACRSLYASYRRSLPDRKAVDRSGDAGAAARRIEGGVRPSSAAGAGADSWGYRPAWPASHWEAMRRGGEGGGGVRRAARARAALCARGGQGAPAAPHHPSPRSVSDGPPPTRPPLDRPQASNSTSFLFLLLSSLRRPLFAQIRQQVGHLHRGHRPFIPLVARLAPRAVERLLHRLARHHGEHDGDAGVGGRF